MLLFSMREYLLIRRGLLISLQSISQTLCLLDSAMMSSFYKSSLNTPNLKNPKSLYRAVMAILWDCRMSSLNRPVSQSRTKISSRQSSASIILKALRFKKVLSITLRVQMASGSQTGTLNTYMQVLSLLAASTPSLKQLRKRQVNPPAQGWVNFIIFLLVMLLKPTQRSFCMIFLTEWLVRSMKQKQFLQVVKMEVPFLAQSTMASPWSRKRAASKQTTSLSVVTMAVELAAGSWFLSLMMPYEIMMVPVRSLQRRKLSLPTELSLGSTQCDMMLGKYWFFWSSMFTFLLTAAHELLEPSFTSRLQPENQLAVSTTSSSSEAMGNCLTMSLLLQQGVGALAMELTCAAKSRMARPIRLVLIDIYLYMLIQNLLPSSILQLTNHQLACLN